MPARAPMLMIRNRALYTACRWTTTRMADTAATRASPEKNAISTLSPQHQHGPGGRRRDVEQRQGQQPLPPKVHELVISEPRQRGPEPDEQEQQEEDLPDEPDRGRGDGSQPSPQE